MGRRARTALAVPEIGRTWIMECLQKKNESSHHRISSFGEINDLHVLTVADLKMLWNELRTLACTNGLDNEVGVSKPAQKQKKAVWLEAVQNFFYTTNAARTERHENKTFSRALHGSLQHDGSGTSHEDQTKNRSNAKALSSPSSPSAQPPTHPSYNNRNSLSTSYSVPHTTDASPGQNGTLRMPPYPPSQYASFPPLPPCNPPYHPIVTTATKRQSPSKKKTPSPRKKAKTKTPPPHPKIKIENQQQQQQQIRQMQQSPLPADYDTRPRTPLEQASLQCLQQMGFQNVREMLGGIRHVMDQIREDATTATATTPHNTIMTTPPTMIAEMAMMWIVAQREEMEEARKMDQARLSSEQYRKEQAQKVKLSWEQQLSNATSFQTLHELFPKSTILQETKEKWNVETTTDKDEDEEKKKKKKTKRHKSQRDQHDSTTNRATSNGWLDYTKVKDHIIRLLQLEQKAQKWYGLCVPWRYFVQLSEQVLSISNNTQEYETTANTTELTATSKEDTDSTATNSGAISSEQQQQQQQQQQIADRIRQEAIKLEHIMYTLSQQQGGVPRLFLQARAQAKKKGLPIDPDQSLQMTSATSTKGDKTANSNHGMDNDDDDDDHDDEVVVLVDNFDIQERTGAKNNGTIPSKPQQPRSVTPGKSKQIEVIEIS